MFLQNYHKHTYWSNLYSMDSIASYEDYAKRAVDLGHKILCSVEHGWQSNYWQCYEMAKKYNLKFVFGTEAYYVKDRTQPDKTNCHIIILAKNENGRQAINELLSQANETGYYYRPRIDREMIFTLPPRDVFITSRCVAFWGYGLEDSDELILALKNYFKDNFMLEIQNHSTEKQIALNVHIKELSKKYNIPMIAGLDSHYIYPEDAIMRDEALKSKGIDYADEQGWYMDYPSDVVCFERFKAQEVFTDDEIQQAMDNTDVILSFADYDGVPVFTSNIKLPTIYPNLSQEGRNKKYSVLITKKFKEYVKNIPADDYDKYFQGVKEEVKVYKETGMVDYPLLNYEIIKKGIANGGIITDTARGSASGFFTNTLCGFSTIDRFKAPIKIYPDRFMSTARILETHSLPDIDFNVANTEPFEKAQKEVLGEDHAYPMIAFGTLKKKSAFKLLARAKDIDAQTANEITKQIAKYEKALAHADEDYKEEISIYDLSLN